MDGVFRDLKYAARSLLANPGFTAATVLCLALGIGANTAAFSFVNGFLLQPIPHVKDSERLARIYVSYEGGMTWGSLSHPDAVDLATLDVYESVSLDRITPLSLARADGPSQRLWGALVTRNYFEALRVTPFEGRFFHRSESATAETDATVVLSHALWTNSFGGEASVLGTSIELNGQPFDVVGIAPEGFTGVNRGIANDLWIPIEAQEALGGGALDVRGSRSAFSVARLAPGTSLAQAQAATEGLSAALKETYPDEYAGKSFTVIPESRGRFHPLYRSAFVAFLVFVMVVVGLVLLVACANVAGLLLARAASRAKEMGLRQALGASRSRLLRQLLIESLLLSVLAGFAGLWVGLMATRAVGMLRPNLSEVPVEMDLAFDWRVLAFTTACALLTSILFGMAPGLRATRVDLAQAVKQRAVGLGGRTRLRGALVVSQMALSMMLLVAAVLFLRGLQSARLIDPGFRADGIVMGAIDLGQAGYGPDEASILLDALKADLLANPEIEQVAFAFATPFTLFRRQDLVWPQGRQLGPDQSAPLSDVNDVGVDYFDLMGIELEEGRAFNETDTNESKNVVIVNRKLAEDFWPEGEALGKILEVSGTPREVVGVAATGKYVSLGEEPLPYIYTPAAENWLRAQTVFLRTRAAPENAHSILHEQVRSLDASLPVYGQKTMEEQMGVALLPARLGVILLMIFGGLALLLSAVGLYGVVAFAVARSVGDIGLRVALGAQSRDILRWVLGRGMSLVAIGLAVGTIGMVAASGLLRRFLYGVEPLSPMVYFVVLLVLGTAGLAACLVPAQRALAVSPLSTLRSE